MKKTFKGILAIAFCIVTIFTTMVMASAVSKPKAKVKTVTYNTVTISWAEIKDADGGYEIQRSAKSSSGFKTIATVKKGTTSYKDSKLTTGKTYYYRVRAIDKTLFGKKYSDWSSAVKATPVPAKVTGVKASPTYNSVKLTWSKVSGASGYEVQVYSKKKWKSLKTTSKNTLTITKLKLGTTYQYRVRAYKTVSKKKVYGAVSSTIKTSPTLKAPSTFVLKGISTTSLTLSWSKVDGAKGYEVLRSTDGKKWTTINAKTKTSLTVNKLKAGTKYYFAVRAYSGKYDGTKSATRTYYTTPAAASGLKVTKATADSLALSWSKTTGASGYQVQYSTDNKKWTNLSATSKTTATISKLSSGTKYFVRVRAYVKNSNVHKDISATSYGAYSSTLTTYTNVAAPKTITFKSATASSLTFEWSSSTGAASYEYYNPATSKWVSTKTTRSATITGLKAGTKYSIKVKAIGSNKSAAESSAVSFTTAPAAVTNLKCNSLELGGVIVSDATSNSIKISWTGVSGAAGYRVQYSTDNKTWTNLTTSSTSATISGLRAATAYSIKVQAYVKNSSATTYGAEAKIVAKTLTAATTTVTTASLSTIEIKVNWNAVSNVSGYVVEKFSTGDKDWVAYDFTENNWISYGDISDDNSIVTTETSITDTKKGGQGRSDIYRVRLVDSDGYVCGPSAVVNGDTADVDVSVGAYTTEITFKGTEGAKTIEVYPIYPYQTSGSNTIKSGFTYENGWYKVKISLAPGAIQSVLLIARDENNLSKGSTGTILVQTQPLKALVSASSPDYNASVNSQLLYLTQAINNTKTYNGKITVKLVSSINTNCGDLEIYRNGKRSEVLELLLGSLLGDELKQEIKDSQNYTYTFTDGKAKDSNNITIQLRNFLEPNTNATRYAYLYNGCNPDAWRNGITGFTSTISNGKLTVSFKLKKETNDPLYHDGFLSALNSKSLSQEGLTTEEVVVGESTINAKIGSDYLLESYGATAPFSGKFSMSMTAEENADGGIKEGDSILFKIPIDGKSSFTYTFSK